MNNIIMWCNQNQGFVSAILSLVTILLSAIAIIISVIVAKIPFRKKVVVECGNTISVNEIGYHVTAVNIGNRNVKIRTIGFFVVDKVIINTNTLEQSAKVLLPTEESSQYFSKIQMDKAISVYRKYPNKKVYGCVIDSEGKKYLKYLCRVREI